MLDARIGSDSGRRRCAFSTEKAPKRVVVLLSVVMGGNFHFPRNEWQ
jgi:hypothetical protein